MWKRIDTPETFSEIITGCHITDDPENPDDFYQVRGVLEGNIIALHANGKVRLKIFDEMELVEKWWLKY